jgi:hypothetical protein
MKGGPPPVRRSFSRVRGDRLQRAAACAVLSKMDIVHLGSMRLAGRAGSVGWTYSENRAEEKDRIVHDRSRPGQETSLPRRPRPGRGQVARRAVSRGAPPRSGALDEKKGGSGSPFLPIERGRRFDRGSAGGVGGRGRVRAPLKEGRIESAAQGRVRQGGR